MASVLYAFSILIGIPIILFILNIVFMKSRFNFTYIAATAAILIYVGIVFSALNESNKIEAEMIAFDLNKDGEVTGLEITPNYQKTTERWAHDTGRNMAPLFGAVFSIIYFIVLNTLYKIINFIKRVIYYART